MEPVARRRFLIAASALLAAPLARAQAPAKLPTLGVLSPSRRVPIETLRKRLGELGWLEDKTYLIERAYGQGNKDRLPELASMLVAKKVDVIWAFGPEAALAAARATRTIPIVFWGVAYPVESGLVDSLHKPGQNVTGVAWRASAEVEAKRIQYLREIAPDALRLAWLRVPSATRTVAGDMVTSSGDTHEAASRDLGFELRRFEVRRAADFEPAFAAIVKWGAQALMVAGTTLTWDAKDRIIAFALRHRLPAVYASGAFIAAGGLISYAADLRQTWVRSFEYVDKILRGAKPAELPVDLPKKYELAVNLKTAKALGLTVPPSIMVSADRVIE